MLRKKSHCCLASPRILEEEARNEIVGPRCEMLSCEARTRLGICETSQKRIKSRLAASK